MTLGPAPTGRLSSSLLNALAPALRAEQPTLASSISQGAAYTLSPPPAQRRPVDATPRPPPIPAFRPHAPSPATRKPGSGLMLPPPVPATRTRPAVASSSPAAATPSPSPRKRRQRSIDSDELSPTAADFDTAPGPVDFAVPPPRARSRSLSTFSARSSTPSGRGASRPPNSTPRKKTRLELEIEHVAQAIDDDDLEWGMDEDVGADDARQWREGSVVSYV
ncbi:hypothetical protein Q8F55_007029 [Vanrija albida]|uniref:Uncharacterized protein n=1 Tax=Vanrija albida TaxID=181172 RepID=A0ABR3PZ84_9TREE